MTSDTPTTEAPPLTNAGFAAICARIASRASSWSADVLLSRRVEPLDEPMARDHALRFCDDIERLTKMIREGRNV